MSVGASVSVFCELYAIVYHVLLRTGLMDIYDFTNDSLKDAEGKGGGRGPKNISLVIIVIIPDKLSHFLKFFLP